MCIIQTLIPVTKEAQQYEEQPNSQRIPVSITRTRKHTAHNPKAKTQTKL
jgi:hypothetical protein